MSRFTNKMTIAVFVCAFGMLFSIGVAAECKSCSQPMMNLFLDSCFPTSCQDWADAGYGTKGSYPVNLGGSEGNNFVATECSFDSATKRVAADECKSCSQPMMKLLMDSCFPTSCQDWADAGYETNGSYPVNLGDSAGKSFVAIECGFDSETKKALSVIHHDSEANITMTAGCEDAMCYKRDVTYKASMKQIGNLIDASSRCYQSIHIDCKDVVLHYNGVDYAAWYGRDGSPNYYWSGKTPGGKNCACDLTGTCKKEGCEQTQTCGDKGIKCACDANQNDWRVDEGKLERKDSLPVTKLAFGDLDDPKEQGFHTLGPLICER